MSFTPAARSASQESILVSDFDGTITRYDFAALLSDATVFQLMASPRRDQEGIRLLATALMLNGVAMEIAGSSRPASGRV
jgi:glycerol dehydrogenase-like iron-containing ADH family enzyme